MATQRATGRATGPGRRRSPLRPVLAVASAVALGLSACTAAADGATGRALDAGAVDRGPVDAREPDEGRETEPAILATWPLTGLVARDEAVERPAFAVKVSNSPEARPQTGLDRADVVYEEVTEAGITRFLAVFHSQLPEVVGPVRSARPVDTQILAGLGTPGFAYSGARDEVRALLATTPAASIAEGAPGFFRDDGTHASHPFAPHDLFLRVTEGLDAVTRVGAEPLVDLGWSFSEEPPSEPATDLDGTSIDIHMSSSFRSGWTYDADAGVYRRDQNGSAALVTGSGRIGAANVVVLDVRHHTGDSGYPETDVVGQGPALVLRNGQRYAARWSKPSATSPLRLTTATGTDPFTLAPGPTWIHLPDDLPGA